LLGEAEVKRRVARSGRARGWGSRVTASTKLGGRSGPERPVDATRSVHGSGSAPRLGAGAARAQRVTARGPALGHGEVTVPGCGGSMRAGSERRLDRRWPAEGVSPGIVRRGARGAVLGASRPLSLPETPRIGFGAPFHWGSGRRDEDNRTSASPTLTVVAKAAASGTRNDGPISEHPVRRMLTRRAWSPAAWQRAAPLGRPAAWGLGGGPGGRWSRPTVVSR
jgi:hypothetical protein